MVFYTAVRITEHDTGVFVEALVEKFRAYAASFKGAGAFCDENIDLKVEHTLRVASEMARLCAAEKIARRLVEPAYYTAILHDLSRFSQFRQSGSFNDAESFDHGDRSAEIAAAEGWVAGLDHHLAEVVLTAVCWHNKAALPDGLSPDALTLARLIRDADKLDIFKVVLRHLEHPGNGAVTFSLDPDAGVSPEIAESIAAGRQVAHRDMRSAADFVAAKLLWVYDLNFAWSHAEFLRRNYIAQLMEHLPDDELLRTAARRAGEHCRAHSV